MTKRARSTSRGGRSGRVRVLLDVLRTRASRMALRLGLWIAGMVAVTSGAVYGLTQLELSIEDRLQQRFTPRTVFLDLPPDMVRFAMGDLQQATQSLLHDSWTASALPGLMAHSIEQSGWVSLVHQVRRTSDARFLISCRYRKPLAFVHQGKIDYLVDRDGVRLPGKYTFDSTWKMIQGVAKPAPESGKAWDGADIHAGLAVIEAIVAEPFAYQISSVLVENHGGRRDRWRSHLELATDQPGGRIRWGSAPGSEIEENSIARKLAILRENFNRTGRVDAQYPLIDISTFPDRFTVPG